MRLLFHFLVSGHLPIEFYSAPLICFKTCYSTFKMQILSLNHFHSALESLLHVSYIQYWCSHDLFLVAKFHQHSYFLLRSESLAFLFLVWVTNWYSRFFQVYLQLRFLHFLSGGRVRERRNSRWWRDLARRWSRSSSLGWNKRWRSRGPCRLLEWSRELLLCNGQVFRRKFLCCAGHGY